MERWVKALSFFHISAVRMSIELTRCSWIACVVLVPRHDFFEKESSGIAEKTITRRSFPRDTDAGY